MPFLKRARQRVQRSETFCRAAFIVCAAGTFGAWLNMFAGFGTWWLFAGCVSFFVLARLGHSVDEWWWGTKRERQQPAGG